MATYTGQLPDPNTPQLSPGDRMIDNGQVYTLLGVHSGAGWGRQWVPGEFPEGQVILDDEEAGQSDLSSPDPPNGRRLVAVSITGALVVTLGFGFASGHKWAPVLLLVAAGVGLLFGGVIAAIKLLRDEKAPMWTYRKKDGRKVHGFFNWWGTVAGIWTVAVFLFWDCYKIAGLIRYWWDLVGIWWHG